MKLFDVIMLALQVFTWAVILVFAVAVVYKLTGHSPTTLDFLTGLALAIGAATIKLIADTSRLKSDLHWFRLSARKDFDRVDRQFEGITRRFEQMDRRFDQVDHRFTQIEKRLVSIDRKLSAQS